MPLFSVLAEEHARAGQSRHDVVKAGPCDQALHLAAARAGGLLAPAGPGPQPGGADHRSRAGAWVRPLVRGELAEGHDRPQMAAAPGYRRPARRVRDGRGMARALPGPGTGPGTRT